MIELIHNLSTYVSTIFELYIKTLEWGYNNRILGKTDHRRFEEYDLDVFGENVIIDECTEKLIYYISKAKQVLDYGNIKI